MTTRNQLVIPALALVLSAFTPATKLTPVTGIVQSIPAIQWKSTELDLGNIPQGEPKTVVFEFYNTGKEPVVINNVRPGCGCTLVDYPKEPVAPGQLAKIVATYNAATKGAFTKNVTVTTSAEENPRVLVFRGTVI